MRHRSGSPVSSNRTLSTTLNHPTRVRMAVDEDAGVLRRHGTGEIGVVHNGVVQRHRGGRGIVTSLPDVEGLHDVGEFGSQQFVAMEYVVGEMYIQAGRGLAAAHAAGIT